MTRQRMKENKKASSKSQENAHKTRDTGGGGVGVWRGFKDRVKKESLSIYTLSHLRYKCVMAKSPNTSRKKSAKSGGGCVNLFFI